MPPRALCLSLQNKGAEVHTRHGDSPCSGCTAAIIRTARIFEICFSESDDSLYQPGKVDTEKHGPVTAKSTEKPYRTEMVLEPPFNRQVRPFQTNVPVTVSGMEISAVILPSSETEYETETLPSG